MSDMPKYIYVIPHSYVKEYDNYTAYGSAKTGVGEMAKYRRVDPDEIVIKRSELEGMRLNPDKYINNIYIHCGGYNQAIDDISERGE